MKKRLRRYAPVVDSLEGRLMLSAAPQFTVKDLYEGIDIAASPASLSIDGKVDLNAIFIQPVPHTAISPNGQLFIDVSGNFNPNNNITSTYLNGTNIGYLPESQTTIGDSVNNSGDIVGTTLGPNEDVAFLYTNGTMYDLNSLLNCGLRVYNAAAINDSGQILVNAQTKAEVGIPWQNHVLLLTPVPPAPVAPTITWSNPADIVYGTPLSATQLDATSDVPGTFTYDVAEGTVLHAGAAQVIHATFTPDDLVHYTTATATASINVKKAWVSLTSQNGTKVYGADVPHLGVSYGPLYENGVEVGPGFVNGDTAANLTTQPTVIVTDRIGNPVTSASPVAPPNPPGVPDATTYYIVQAYGAYSPDYEFAYRSGQFRITPAPLTVTASNATKVYGAALPTLTASYSGFVNGDTAVSLATQATATTSATTASPVGSYAITASGATDPNYAITYLDGTLTVTPAPLTVTANNAQVRYPFPIPRLTGTITGLVNGDTDVATYTTTAVQGSWAGYYPIVPHLTDPNYNITFVNGTLTIYWNVPPGGY